MASKMIDVVYKENYAILSMKSGENKLNPKFLKEFHCALDEIESESCQSEERGPWEQDCVCLMSLSWVSIETSGTCKCNGGREIGLKNGLDRNKDIQFLITTGDGKFYSNGLDLEFLSKCNTEELLKTLNTFTLQTLRLLTFPVPTIAALNGHAFAGGAIRALAHDYRVMRTKRGWFCLPEVNLGMQFGEANILLIRAKIKDPKTLSDAILMGKRYVAEEALSGGIVQKICPVEELLDAAVQMGQEAVGQNEFNRRFFKQFKSNLYREIVDAYQNQVIDSKKTLGMLVNFSRSSKL